MPRILSARLLGGCSLALACLVAAGCGYFGGSPAVPAARSGLEAQAPAAVDPAARVLAGMVEAVGPSGSQPPIELRFSLHDRPQVDHDDELDYAVIPQVGGIDTLRVVFAALKGLQVVSQGPALAAIKPASGVPIFGSVTVRPVQTGLFTLTAAIAVQSSGSDSVVWTFTIPVIAGEAPAQTAANQP